MKNDEPCEVAPATVAAGIFATTRWSVVLAAGGSEDTPASRSALEELCRTYWFSVYALARRRGLDPDAARDATQEFFARMLSRDGFAKARRERGRFRAFLAQSLRNFLADEWSKTMAEKRGGGRELLSLDAEAAEGRYLESPTLDSPDRLFDRHWAEQLIASAHVRLRIEYEQDGREEWLAVLDRVGEPGAPPLADEAERLGVPLNTLKSHLRRARLRQGAILRELIAETVTTPAEVEQELRHLLEALQQ